MFTERDIFSLRLAPLEEQIQALVRQERVEEALLLLDGVQGREPLDSYKVKRNLLTHNGTQASLCLEILVINIS